MYTGTTYTSGSTVDQWVVYNGNTSTPDDTSDWWTTNDATFEITGVQLEVGPVATPFEHRSFAQEALLCKRYYQQIVGSGDLVMFGSGRASGTSNAIVSTHLAVPLRASPTISSLNYTGWGIGGAHNASNKTPVAINFDSTDNQLNLNYEGLGGNLTNGRTATVSSYLSLIHI